MNRGKAKSDRAPDEKRKADEKNKKPDSAKDLVCHVTPHPVIFCRSLTIIICPSCIRMVKTDFTQHQQPLPEMTNYCFNQHGHQKI